jgi:hypothetical protein
MPALQAREASGTLLSLWPGSRLRRRPLTGPPIDHDSIRVPNTKGRRPHRVRGKRDGGRGRLHPGGMRSRRPRRSFGAMTPSTTVRWSCLAGRELRAKAASPSSRRLWVEPYPWLLSTTGATGSEGQPLRPRPAGLTGVRGGNARNGDADPADLPGGMSLECRWGRRARNRTGFSRSER